MSESTDDPVVRKRIGKNDLQMHESHRLPEYLAEFPFYDRALPRISSKVKEIDQYLSIVDIGANIGDTVALISETVVGSFLCIEGDPEYLPFLKTNLAGLEGIDFAIEESYAGESDNQGEGLKIRRVDGTARLEEGRRLDEQEDIEIRSLDSIIDDHPGFKKSNILKIDTDGFEIAVIRGGKHFLNDARPIIFFEFDPDFYSLHFDDPLDVFDLIHARGYREALIYDNFGIPIKIVDVLNKSEIRDMLKLIDKQKIFYFDVLTYHSSKQDRYRTLFESELLSSISLFDQLLNTTKSELGMTMSELDTTKSALDTTKSALDTTKSALEAAASELESTKSQLTTTASELNATRSALARITDELNGASAKLGAIYASRGWRMLSVIKKLINLLAPRGSLRRRVPGAVFRSVKKTARLFSILAEKRAELAIRSEILLNRLRPARKRNINRDSRKIVYVGHSYHEKTKSTEFLIDYLKEFYDVETVLDESWRGDGQPFPDLSFIDESYLGVIFFQSLPSRDIVDKIANDNLIFFPMYDASASLEYADWRNRRDLKIMNFSKTLHKRLLKWGFESRHVQYFPQPAEFIRGETAEVFFWQRLTRISIREVTKLFETNDLKVHIHKAVDPHQEFIQPQKKDEQRLNITYSDWFETREGMWDMVKQRGIYIAPREHEGIGLSFLEAMAMGKAVIAVDNPTMNEYIKHNETGYLFDLRKPQSIDLSNVDKIQENTYQFMCRGYDQWCKEKSKIIEFVGS